MPANQKFYSVGRDFGSLRGKSTGASPLHGEAPGEVAGVALARAASMDAIMVTFDGP